MPTGSVLQEGGSQELWEPAALQTPRTAIKVPRPRTEGARAFALLREHQHRFHLLPAPCPPEKGWVMLRPQTPQASASFAAQSPPVYTCPNGSQFLLPPLYLLFLFSSIKPHGIFPDPYPQNLKEVALELLLLVHASPL